MPEKDITLYAAWNREKYVVQFDTDGGSLIFSQNVLSGDSVENPEEPKKDGYTFSGWFTDKSYIKEFKFDSLIHGNTTIYAKWVAETFVVNFVTGSSNIPDQYVKNNSCAKLPDTPTREGYVFNGWYTDLSFINKFSFSSFINKDTVLYAKWSVKEE